MPGGHLEIDGAPKYIGLLPLSLRRDSLSLVSPEFDARAVLAVSLQQKADVVNSQQHRLF